MRSINPVKTLLYATDLNEGAIYALRYAVRLAEAVNGKLHVVHALEPISTEARLTLQSYVTDPKLLAQATTRRLDMAQELLAERQHDFWEEAGEEAAHLRERVAAVEVIEGAPADVILRHSVAIGADMILMGSHEHGLSHTFLGTVALRVLRRSRIPTLIVPYPN